jgi:arginine:ornithine antiporter/lysine permease
MKTSDESFSAYTFAYSLATTTIFNPYALTAFYQLKYSYQEKIGTSHRMLNMIVGLVASAYAIWLIYAVGLDYLLLTSIVYAPGILIFIWAHLRKGGKVFGVIELLIAIALVAVCAYAINQIVIGNISI